MKSRFTALDIAAVAKDLQRCLGMRLQNVYDINAKTYLFKFGRPQEKQLVLVESGIRVHSTEFEREKPPQPSPFAMKLRKHIKQRRLTGVRQLGGRDRVLIFEFGGEPLAVMNFNLVCEFYASGNVVLTDGEWKIIAVLRVVKVNETDQYRVGSTLASVANYTPKPRLDLADPDTRQRLLELITANKKEQAKRLLANSSEYPTPIIEHALVSVGIKGNAKLKPDDLNLVLSALAIAEEMMSLPATTDSFKGYIYLTPDAQLYDDLQPFPLAQFADRSAAAGTLKEFDTFNAAADAYFSELESQRALQRVKAQEEAAKKKLEAFEREQAARVDSLMSAQEQAVKKAQVVEESAAIVDAAIQVINSALATGMDWIELEALVEEEKARGNPVAAVIEKLELEKNGVVLRLVDPWAVEDIEQDEEQEDDVSEGDDEESDDAEFLFDSDDEMTMMPIPLALQSAAKRIKQDLEAAAKQTANAAGLQKLRKAMWFERFHWFVSSEGYLVIGGRDMHQNELLVKRYLRPGDVYIHCDLHGAPSIIIKNMRGASTGGDGDKVKPAALGPKELAKDPSGGFPEIPPSTLAQAGNMALCLSKAWDSKTVTSAYWVWWHQVSKSAPTGEYLTTGSFMIRGRKNMLPPSQLVYGLGIVFRLDEESRESHKGERAPRRMLPGETSQVGGSGRVDGQGGEEEEEEEQFDEQDQGDDGADNAEAGVSAVGQEEEGEDVAAGEDAHDTEQNQPAPQPSLMAQLEQLMLDEDSDSDAVAENDREASNTKDQVAKVQSNDIPDVDEAEDGDTASTTQGQDEGKGKRGRISAAERRRLKKAAAAGSAATDSEPAYSPPVPATKKSKQQTQQQQQPANANVRGKKGKLKKAKSKYADQSDDDRELAMDLLKSNQGPQPKGKKEKRKAAQKEQQAEVTRLREEQRAAAAAIKAEMREQQRAERAAAQGEAAGPTADGAADEDEDDDEEAMATNNAENSADQISDLVDSLTGMPRVGDGLQYAVCMCAPYAALNNFKYKVKLTPGTMKKGKSAKLCVQIFQKAAAVAGGSGATKDESKAAEREAALIKAIPEPEWTMTMRAQVKVFAPQLSEVQKGGKSKGGKGGKAKK
ncbi:fibronectin-binding protein A N-terminus-domain-containing protein [Catenaria anguillulae PL171]|uniref:Ribosome quality control complex subunit 2 n=1 Tax=Catenaria anguillulae PL171 TaxID=765915 RepID=A0A1Y2HGS0_9FUNG|nr:fibronectin-binding protein A N-terminus-domain-containing protein [Catenaria anguillulae PL171]